MSQLFKPPTLPHTQQVPINKPNRNKKRGWEGEKKKVQHAHVLRSVPFPSKQLPRRGFCGNCEQESLEARSSVLWESGCTIPF